MAVIKVTADNFDEVVMKAEKQQLVILLFRLRQAT